METDASNTPIAWYVYGLGLLWKVTADGTPYFYHFDGDGNTVALSNPTAGVVNTYRYDAQGRLVSAKEGVENLFHARGEAGWMDEGNGLLFTGSQFQFPELRLTLPATADVSPPVPRPATAALRRGRLLLRRRGQLPRRHRKEDPLMPICSRSAPPASACRAARPGNPGSCMRSSSIAASPSMCSLPRLAQPM